MAAASFMVTLHHGLHHSNESRKRNRRRANCTLNQNGEIVDRGNGSRHRQGRYQSSARTRPACVERLRSCVASASSWDTVCSAWCPVTEVRRINERGLADLAAKRSRRICGCCSWNFRYTTPETCSFHLSLRIARAFLNQCGRMRIGRSDGISTFHKRVRVPPTCSDPLRLFCEYSALSASIPDFLWADRDWPGATHRFLLRAATASARGCR
jgi:hypothetical protein